MPRPRWSPPLAPATAVEAMRQDSARSPTSIFLRLGRSIQTVRLNVKTAGSPALLVKPGRGLLPVGVIRVQPLPRLGVITKFAEEPDSSVELVQAECGSGYSSCRGRDRNAKSRIGMLTRHFGGLCCPVGRGCDLALTRPPVLSSPISIENQPPARCLDIGLLRPRREPQCDPSRPCRAADTRHLPGASP
jgi:hypothetical protein